MISKIGCAYIPSEKHSYEEEVVTPTAKRCPRVKSTTLKTKNLEQLCRAATEDDATKQFELDTLMKWMEALPPDVSSCIVNIVTTLLNYWSIGKLSITGWEKIMRRRLRTADYHILITIEPFHQTAKIQSRQVMIQMTARLLTTIRKLSIARLEKIMRRRLRRADYHILNTVGLFHQAGKIQLWQIMK